VDALFTATSATCVTGLAVEDTQTHFSTFGQIVILCCIQVGGLGLMTFTTVFLYLTGNRLAIADRVALQESFQHTPTGSVGRLVKHIVVATFAVEAVGALLLFARWTQLGRFDGARETVYHSVFHSISAFCNAGFALYPDSLTGFRDDPALVLVFSALVVLGGLGFLVMLDVKEYYAQHRLLRHYRPGRAHAQEALGLLRRPRLTVHTKLVLLTTAALLATGTISYYLLERRGLFAGMGEGTAWLNAFFCSVTARTAGFNTVDYAGMGGAGLLCTMVLMFVGASPGSTGGGVKTSAFGLLVAYAVTRWRGQKRLHAFNRTIPRESIDKAGSVVITAVAVVILAASALMATETRGATPAESRGELVGILFETISAFATVGLSTGETAELTPPGRLIVALVMFVGRTGPLTLALAISVRRRRASQFRYAEENVLVG
jgi:trk system potassium uptake protein TrkH